MRRYAARLAAVVIALLTANTSLQGQTAQLNLQLHVRDVMQMQVTNTSVALPSPTSSTYDAAVASLPVVTGPTISVKSNRAWTVTVSSSSTTFAFAPQSGSGLVNPLKPVSDLSWSNTNFGSGGNLGTPGAFPMSGASGLTTSYAPTAGATGTMYLRTSWLWTRDVPGVYTATITLTLSTP